MSLMGLGPLSPSLSLSSVMFTSLHSHYLRIPHLNLTSVFMTLFISWSAIPNAWRWHPSLGFSVSPLNSTCFAFCCITSPPGHSLILNGVSGLRPHALFPISCTSICSFLTFAHVWWPPSSHPNNNPLIWILEESRTHESLHGRLSFSLLATHTVLEGMALCHAGLCWGFPWVQEQRS